MKSEYGGSVIPVNSAFYCETKGAVGAGINTTYCIKARRGESAIVQRYSKSCLPPLFERKEKMKWGKIHDVAADTNKWQRRFAFSPVRLIDGRWAWLEYIERYENCCFDECYWVYRCLEKESPK